MDLRQGPRDSLVQRDLDPIDPSTSTGIRVPLDRIRLAGCCKIEHIVMVRLSDSGIGIEFVDDVSGVVPPADAPGRN